MTTHPPIPLPLIDGDAIIIDNSSLETYRQCDRKYEYLLQRRRINVESKGALNFGSGLHHALAWRYKTAETRMLTEAEQQNQQDELTAFFVKSPQPADGHRQPSLASKIMFKYNDVYPKEPWKIIQGGKGPIVEASFPSDPERGLLGRVRGFRIIYAGKMDLAVVDQNGDEWVMDHKSAFMFGSGFEKTMEMTPQMPGYVWTFERTFGRKPMGYIVNGIRVRKPTKEDSVTLELSGGVRRDDFQRQYVPCSDDRIAEWQENTLELCDRLVYNYQQGYFPMNNHSSCVSKYGECAFYTVCNSPRHSRDMLLGTSMFEDNNWSPLNTPII